MRVLLAGVGVLGRPGIAVAVGGGVAAVGVVGDVAVSLRAGQRDVAVS